MVGDERVPALWLSRERNIGSSTLRSGKARNWQSERGIVSLPMKVKVGRVVIYDPSKRGQFDWMSEDSVRFDRNTRSYSGKVAIGMSLREIANRYAACGWAVVNMAPCGEMTLRYGVGGIIVVLLKVQRTTKRAEIWVLYMAVCKLSGPSETFTDNRGVVQALNKGEVDCIMPTSRTRTHGLSSRAKLGRWIDGGVDLRIVRRLQTFMTKW